MSLTTNLVSYWKLDESSGNAADSVGSNTLTNTGTATYGTGKINNGIVLNGSSQYAVNTSLSSSISNSSYSVSAWIYPTGNLATTRFAIVQMSASGSETAAGLIEVGAVSPGGASCFTVSAAGNTWAQSSSNKITVNAWNGRHTLCRQCNKHGSYD